jgi:hypothetical protein
VGSTAVLLAVFLAIPAVGEAQTITVTAPPDPTPPVPVSQSTGPELIEGPNGLVRNPNWWQPPVSHSSFPQWAIGHTVAFTTVGGLTLSAGLFGRQGDPLPLYLSEGSGHQALDRSLGGPGSYRQQWDTKFGVSVPVWSNSRVKIRATGELIVPLTRTPSTPTQTAADTPMQFLAARTLRFGVAATF